MAGDRFRQNGMTMWGTLFVVGVFVTIGFIGFKLFPVYMEDMKVESALDSLARQPEVGSMSKADISSSLEKRFDIDNVTEVKLKDSLFVEQKGGMRTIRISYEAVVPMIANVSALLEFNHSREVRGSE